MKSTSELAVDSGQIFGCNPKFSGLGRFGSNFRVSGQIFGSRVTFRVWVFWLFGFSFPGLIFGFRVSGRVFRCTFRVRCLLFGCDFRVSRSGVGYCVWVLFSGAVFSGFVSDAVFGFMMLTFFYNEQGPKYNHI